MFKHCRIMKTCGSITAQTLSLSYLSATLDIFNRCRSNCACQNLIWKDNSGNSQGEYMWVCVCENRWQTQPLIYKNRQFSTELPKKPARPSWLGWSVLKHLRSFEHVFKDPSTCHLKRKIDTVYVKRYYVLLIHYFIPSFYLNCGHVVLVCSLILL